MQPRTIPPVGGRVQLQLGLVLTQWLHALSPQQDNNAYARLRAVLELQHEWLQLGVVPHTTGFNPVVVPHTMGLNPVVVPHTTVATLV
jgi:hypothetical protein